MRLATTTICAENFPSRMRGAIIGITGSCVMLAPALYGKIYLTWFDEEVIGNYFLLLAVLCVAMNLLSIWILRPIDSCNGSDSEEKGSEYLVIIQFRLSTTTTAVHLAGGWSVQA